MLRVPDLKSRMTLAYFIFPFVTHPDVLTQILSKQRMLVLPSSFHFTFYHMITNVTPVSGLHIWMPE